MTSHGDVNLEYVDREKLLIQSLARGVGLDHSVEYIRALDTHISWALLTGDFACKIKKPIKLAFNEDTGVE